MRITGSLNPYSLLSSLEPESSDTLVIDLSSVSFVEPVGLVGLAALAEQARKDNRNVTLISPTNSSVANYLSRMNFGTALGELGINYSLPSVNARPLPGDLLELQKFSGQGGGEQVARLVFDKLEKVADNEVRQTLYEAICEVAANVEFHADTSHGYVAAQTTHAGGQVLFAIADSGQGLRASLSKVYEIADDSAAVSAAVQPEISGTGERARGQGLPAVVGAAGGLYGAVDIASGNARDRHTGGKVTSTNTTGSFPGTIIQVQLDCSPRL
jgi:hypothetical protein